MANPAFSDRVLNKISTVTDENKMTIQGTINKSGILLMFLVAGAAIGWTTDSAALLLLSFVSSLALSLLIIFGPQRAPYLSQAYALSEGVLLGSISSVYAASYPGIVSNALFLTIGCFTVMLAIYRAQLIRVTEKLYAVITGATLAICLAYLVNIAMRFFGSEVPMIHQATPLGIAFSVFVVVVAALNLLLDFDMIEKAAAKESPKFMEWYGGFALLITIVWLYIEILRLLSKLNRK